jgi:transcriptional regulator NrdR family protein
MDLLKKHVCESCNRKFTRIEELMQHKQVTHGKDLLYECKRCGVAFTGMEQIRDHAKKFHSYNKMKSR